MKFINQLTDAIIYADKHPDSKEVNLKDGDMVSHHYNVTDIKFKVPNFDRNGCITSYNDFNLSKNDLKEILDQIEEIQLEEFDCEYYPNLPF